MRLTAALFAIAALGFASAASAQTIQPASFSSEFRETLDEDLGAREGRYLSEAVTGAVSAALARRGISDGAGSIEIEIVDARPNRPTFQQLADRPGLSMSSISIGGAELRAVLRGADGRELATVEHDFYSHDLIDASFGAGTWSDARRSIRRFAEKVADAYAANAR